MLKTVVQELSTRKPIPQTVLGGLEFRVLGFRAKGFRNEVQWPSKPNYNLAILRDLGS